MGIHTVDAMVLRRYPFRETSVIVTCLTDAHGKLKGIVKGLRGPSNRHRSAMEPLTINRIVFYDTRASQLHLISQCELLSSFPALPADLERMRLAASCVELVDAVVPLELPQRGIYALLVQMVQRLAAGSNDLVTLRVHFVARLLRLAGFQPQLDECTGCGTQVHTQGYWSARQGGLLCGRCLHEDSAAVSVTQELLDCLERASHSDDPVPLEGPLGGLLQQRLNEFLHWQLDRPLKLQRTLQPTRS